MSRRSLHQILLASGELQIDKWIHYLDIYERHLRRFVDTSPVVLEIGVKDGGSLGMWHEYFGSGCRIVGVDIDPKCQRFASDGIDVHIGDQGDQAFLAGLVDHYAFDVIVDDGSHKMAHMRTSFESLYAAMDPLGVYIVEDTHTCYLPTGNYGGGLDAPENFMNFVRDRIDEMHAHYTKDALPVSEFTRSTDSIAVYDSMVVFERRPQARRQAIKTNGMRLRPPGSSAPERG